MTETENVKVDLGKPRAILKNVTIQTAHTDDGPVEIARGNVYGHHNPSLFDGMFVTTSVILSRSDTEIETRNTIYEISMLEQ